MDFFERYTLITVTLHAYKYNNFLHVRTKFVKDRPISFWEKDVANVNHNTRYQPIAINHLSDSGDLKTSVPSLEHCPTLQDNLMIPATQHPDVEKIQLIHYHIGTMYGIYFFI